MGNARGNSSDITTCICYDIDNLDKPASWQTIDLSKPLANYVPVYFVRGSLETENKYNLDDFGLYCDSHYNEGRWRGIFKYFKKMKR